MTGDENAELAKWFWRSSFSHRYSGNPQRNIRRDIAEAVELRMTGTSSLASIPCTPDLEFFRSHTFNIRTVATKAFILLLAGIQPRTFLSGEYVELDEVLAEPNRSEYHHCFPRAYLNDEGRTDTDVLANFAIISRAENRTIGGKPPSEYRSLMPAQVEPSFARP